MDKKIKSSSTEFDYEYEIQKEPSREEKIYAWNSGIGLQAVDGLTTSEYLKTTARDNIDGKIDIDTACRRIETYYISKEKRNEKTPSEFAEADTVSARIAKLLSRKSFRFSPGELISIHSFLFSGIYPHAGKIRQHEITKKEWVLNGDSVSYVFSDTILDALAYDFDQEQKFSYRDLSVNESIKHISKFISGVWQIHPFYEGNTRTTAVFLIRYLRRFGLALSNEPFTEHSWYFRNSLVRANYRTMKVQATTEFLEKFLQNLILGTKHELKNRYLHISNSATDVSSPESGKRSP